MVVSALVVTLSCAPTGYAEMVARLAADPRVVVGERIRDRVPIVTETDSELAGAALLEELERQDGIAKVDVVSIDFEVP